MPRLFHLRDPFGTPIGFVDGGTEHVGEKAR